MVQKQTPHVKLDEQDFTFFSPTEAVCLSHEYRFTLRTFKHSCHVFKLALCNFNIPLLLMTPAVNCSSRSLTYVNALSTLPSAQTGMRHAQTALHCYFIMLYVMHSVQHCWFITTLLVFWAFNIFVSIIFFSIESNQADIASGLFPKCLNLSDKHSKKCSFSFCAFSAYAWKMFSIKELTCTERI